ncbi:MAG TPA: lipase maturation factor family protein [Terriglobia bacterium]|nr:lipase maturation factor family protein [Terriglobia bacterium]
MNLDFKSAFRRLFGPEHPSGPGHLWPRWLFLRALGVIFFSAFYSLAFQIEGLVGPNGILPAHDYLTKLKGHTNFLRYWYAPTLLWLGSGTFALHLLVWAGLLASVALFFNIWPRGTTAIALVAYLSFIAAARNFADYQSDGMLLATGFVSLFFAPAGFRPGLGESSPPSLAGLFLLQWEWFRIYFESGVAKLASHDPQWQHLTAMYQYYQNGPLPTWIGWYAQQLPHAFQIFLALFTLIAELAICWLFIFSRRSRLVCFLILTPFQIGIILTANYAFLNYLVLSMGFLLLDDRNFASWFGWLKSSRVGVSARFKFLEWKTPRADAPARRASAAGLAASGVFLTWIFYATTVLLLLMFNPALPLPLLPVEILQPFRIANQYGLFAVMTRARYEIEFQGSRDGEHWIAYPFRYKPQDPGEAPGIYAPYQPRFDWNLWFASLSDFEHNLWVMQTETLLLKNDASVLSLFRSNPFPGKPPLQVRAVVWQYWFTDFTTKHETGRWWNRTFLGLYAPDIERSSNGQVLVRQWPRALPPPQ